MSKALSLDLRQRTLAAVQEEGLTHPEAAARFKVSAASVSRWRALAAEGIPDLVTPRECQNMFAAAGYDPDWWD